MLSERISMVPLPPSCCCKESSKNQRIWGSAQQKSFEKIQVKLSSTQLLAVYIVVLGNQCLETVVRQKHADQLPVHYQLNNTMPR